MARPRLVRPLIAEAAPGRLAGFVAEGPLEVRHVTDVYLDTRPRDGRLVRAGMRARLRFAGATVTLGVKRSGVRVGNVATRVELEGPATRSLSPGRWPASPARDALLVAIGEEPLQVIARLRQRRLVRIVRRGPTRIELSLDALAAVAGGTVVARRHELEAELLEGDEGDLADLSEVLARIEGVGPALESKLAFALRAAASANTGC